jgi:hypothetical protein
MIPNGRAGSNCDFPRSLVDFRLTPNCRHSLRRTSEANSYHATFPSTADFPLGYSRAGFGCGARIRTWNGEIKTRSFKPCS